MLESPPAESVAQPGGQALLALAKAFGEWLRTNFPLDKAGAPEREIVKATNLLIAKLVADLNTMRGLE